MKTKYAIIGAGPTGLGAANRLRELGEESFVVLERNAHVGGLSASFKDETGFTWDIGGHVMFSHYEYYDRLIADLLGSDYLEHERESWVRVAGTWVPYPYQNNIRHLPAARKWQCVQGLLPGHRPEKHPSNFHEWIEHVFGPGIGETFLWPYNYKVWATPPELMSYSWIGERVSVIDLESVLENILMEKDDVGWGPNNTFQFPLNGGTGEIFIRLAARVLDRIKLEQPVVNIDPGKKEIRTSQGMSVEYEYLLNTAPLDLLAGEWLTNSPAVLRDAAGNLAHNSVHVAGIGLDGVREDSRCWMYFPEGDSPFYRVTNFHNYSPNLVAEPGRQRALMCEVSASEHKPENPGTIIDRSIRGLVNTTLMDKEDNGRVVSRWQHDVEYGYPVPTLERDSALKVIQPVLESHDIYSRGRFGGWKYEVGNMDHSVMQGVEWAQRMILKEPETTYTLK